MIIFPTCPKHLIDFFTPKEEGDEKMLVMPLGTIDSNGIFRDDLFFDLVYIDKTTLKVVGTEADDYQPKENEIAVWAYKEYFPK